MNEQITIFYSWQSDLPSSDTRNVIEGGIKDAVKLLRDTVDIEPDRDTKGKTGSPDISQTIFSKIDECDIFVADVTAVTKIEKVDKDGRTRVKNIPNPNVMLELGYAVQVLGWENVICVLNSDYGSVEDMPFDIQKRRLTPFSLKGDDAKAKAKKYIKGIIQETVEGIIENGKRTKSGFSELKIGCLDEGKFVNYLVPLKVSESKQYKDLMCRNVKICKETIEIIKQYKIPHPEMESTKDSDNAAGSELQKAIKSLSESMSFGKEEKIEISEKDRRVFIKNAKSILNIDISLDDEIFYFGSLKKEFDILNNYEYVGDDIEINKYESFKFIKDTLFIMSIWQGYVKTFDDYILLPLVIENNSSITDEDIDVYVNIDANTVDVIYPSEYLIVDDMKGLEGVVYEEGIIETILKRDESSLISYDSDISFDIEDSQAKLRASMGGINGYYGYDSEDYVRELKKYIATPMLGKNNEFSFHINQLRAYENKWLGASLLLRPKDINYGISYSIKSRKSDGSLSGTINYKK